MTTSTRLAIIDHGESVVRLLAAIGNPNRDAGLLSRPSSSTPVTPAPWYAREADAALAVPAEAGPEGLATALRENDVAAIWPGDPAPYGTLLEVVAAARRLAWP